MPEPRYVVAAHGPWNERTFDWGIVRLPGTSVARVYAYEVTSSTEWAFGRFAPRFSPSVFVDVSRTLERKLCAMEPYESERTEFPHPRSRKALETAAIRWGSVIGIGAAEAFERVWSRR